MAGEAAEDSGDLAEDRLAVAEQAEAGKLMLAANGPGGAFVANTRSLNMLNEKDSC